MTRQCGWPPPPPPEADGCPAAPEDEPDELPPLRLPPPHEAPPEGKRLPELPDPALRAGAGTAEGRGGAVARAEAEAGACGTVGAPGVLGLAGTRVDVAPGITAPVLTLLAECVPLLREASARTSFVVSAAGCALLTKRCSRGSYEIDESRPSVTTRLPEAPATIVRDTRAGGALAARLEEITSVGFFFKTDHCRVSGARVE